MTSLNHTVGTRTCLVYYWWFSSAWNSADSILVKWMSGEQMEDMVFFFFKKKKKYFELSLTQAVLGCQRATSHLPIPPLLASSDHRVRKRLKVQRFRQIVDPSPKQVRVCLPLSTHIFAFEGDKLEASSGCWILSRLKGMKGLPQFAHMFCDSPWKTLTATLDDFQLRSCLVIHVLKLCLGGEQLWGNCLHCRAF